MTDTKSRAFRCRGRGGAMLHQPQDRIRLTLRSIHPLKAPYPCSQSPQTKKAQQSSDYQAFHQSGWLDSNQRPHAPQRWNLFFPIKVINFILVYLHHVQRIAILTYCHLLRFFLYHFCTTNYFASENGLLCSHRFTEIQTQLNGVSHSPIMRH